MASINRPWSTDSRDEYELSRTPTQTHSGLGKTPSPNHNRRLALPTHRLRIIDFLHPVIKMVKVEDNLKKKIDPSAELEFRTKATELWHQLSVLQRSNGDMARAPFVSLIMRIAKALMCYVDLTSLRTNCMNHWNEDTKNGGMFTKILFIDLLYQLAEIRIAKNISGDLEYVSFVTMLHISLFYDSGDGVLTLKKLEDVTHHHGENWCQAGYSAIVDDSRQYSGGEQHQERATGVVTLPTKEAEARAIAESIQDLVPNTLSSPDYFQIQSPKTVIQSPQRPFGNNEVLLKTKNSLYISRKHGEGLVTSKISRREYFKYLTPEARRMMSREREFQAEAECRREKEEGERKVRKCQICGAVFFKYDNLIIHLENSMKCKEKYEAVIAAKQHSSKGRRGTFIPFIVDHEKLTAKQRREKAIQKTEKAAEGKAKGLDGLPLQVYLNGRWEGDQRIIEADSHWVPLQKSYLKFDPIDSSLNGEGSSLVDGTVVPYYLYGTFDWDKGSCTFIKRLTPLHQSFDENISYPIQNYYGEFAFNPLRIVGTYDHGTFILTHQARSPSKVTAEHVVTAPFAPLKSPPSHPPPRTVEIYSVCPGAIMSNLRIYEPRPPPRSPVRGPRGSSGSLINIPSQEVVVVPLESNTIVQEERELVPSPTITTEVTVPSMKELIIRESSILASKNYDLTSLFESRAFHRRRREAEEERLRREKLTAPHEQFNVNMRLLI